MVHIAYAAAVLLSWLLHCETAPTFLRVGERRTIANSLPRVFENDALSEMTTNTDSLEYKRRSRVPYKIVNGKRRKSMVSVEGNYKQCGLYERMDSWEWRRGKWSGSADEEDSDAISTFEFDVYDDIPTSGSRGTWDGQSDGTVRRHVIVCIGFFRTPGAAAFFGYSGLWDDFVRTNYLKWVWDVELVFAPGMLDEPRRRIDVNVYYYQDSCEIKKEDSCAVS